MARAVPQSGCDAVGVRAATKNIFRTRAIGLGREHADVDLGFVARPVVRELGQIADVITLTSARPRS